jgi:hypothetical protein
MNGVLRIVDAYGWWLKVMAAVVASLAWEWFW